MTLVNDNFGYPLTFLSWTLFTVGMMNLSLLVTRQISPVAAGSGIPQMKTQLTGSGIKGYLSFRTCVAKILGLTTAVGSGMYIGQEGPFVHIASCIANCLIFTQSCKVSERAFWKTSILAMKCAKRLQT
tara:strand:+ start:109 stop:495 length:387 start_codon:yes stop_codon:yes gene_type:complete